MVSNKNLTIDQTFLWRVPPSLLHVLMASKGENGNGNKQRNKKMEGNLRSFESGGLGTGNRTIKSLADVKIMTGRWGDVWQIAREIGTRETWSKQDVDLPLGDSRTISLTSHNFSYVVYPMIEKLFGGNVYLNSTIKYYIGLCSYWVYTVHNFERRKK